MSYDVFISYEISDSSLAYELAAILSRHGVTYYLDCASSSFILSEYVERVFTESKLFVPLVSNRYLNEKYACNLLAMASDGDKPMIICAIGGCTLPTEIAGGIGCASIVDSREQDAESVVQECMSCLSGKDEPEDICDRELQETLPVVIEKVSIPHEMESPEADGIVIDEEKKLLLAALLDVLKAHKEAQEETIRYVKPEPPETVLDKGEKTPSQAVWNVITFPIRLLLALFIAAPKLTFTIIVIAIMMKCNGIDRTTWTVGTPKPEYTKEQVEKGKQLNKPGTDYYYGRNGVEVDRKKALGYYEEAAAFGNVDAVYNIGMSCKSHRHDPVAASYYFYQAAQSGHERSFKELKELAESGVAEAQNSLGLCYEYGYCTKVVEKNAAYWYYQAAGQGHSIAQYNIALCYYYGRGVKTNRQEAIRWFRKSAQQGYENAVNMLNRIDGQ